ncbi:hypothetical protein ACQ7A5_26840, partial [Klebsiella pneumoniae]|uniref:hypothetical protein n=1 Tax=Klebsiella pneumoniae TaxID=573 RepID=UPI003D338580
SLAPENLDNSKNTPRSDLISPYRVYFMLLTVLFHPAEKKSSRCIGCFLRRIQKKMSHNVRHFSLHRSSLPICSSLMVMVMVASLASLVMV